MIWNLITKAKELFYKDGKTVEGALDEVNESLGKRRLETYTDLSQLALTTDNTLTEVMASLPMNSEAQFEVSNSITAFTGSLPAGNTTGNYAGVLICRKANNQTRGSVTYHRFSGLVGTYKAEFFNGALSGWEKIALNSDLANYLPFVGGQMRGSVAFKSPYQGTYFYLANGDSVRFVPTDNLGTFAMIYVNSDGLYKSTIMKCIPSDDQSSITTEFLGNATYASKADKANSASVYLGDSTKQCDQIRIRACSASEPYNGFIYLQQRDDGTIEVGLNGRGGVGVHLANKAKCDEHGNIIDDTYATKADFTPTSGSVADGTLSAGAYYDTENSTCEYVRSGNLVTVTFSIKYKADESVNTWLVKGLPKPLVATNGCAFIGPLTDGKPAVAEVEYKDSWGGTVLRYTGIDLLNGASAGDYLIGSITYIAE